MDGAITAVSATSSDAELAALLREQPAAGIAVLYDRYGRLVFSMALRIVNDRGAAEEITQDVFMRCWRNVERYQPSQGSLSSWLLSIAHNRAIDELRSRRGKDARREISDESLGPLASIDPSYDEVLLRNEVQQALRELPPAQREVLELVFWGSLTRREVAEQLQLPLGTVHTRLRLGMDKLREALRRLFADE
ncbi:MAG TPA: sigma-70 family RNA polymerase sigma factor [Kouleothrix sp.]|uniref:sigma-70 family RNA polymerase sigma factor n=1 Tax=Kouleothrix sp. TaxID=2779161 RepID=UPI002C712ED2|nr:sigma-70 family RNA polymerase sigma factor [Kouleothrix sp.]HRC77771.1 sigma-70 family RNA polymerase sigma factor [Kouleothrix sp.]